MRNNTTYILLFLFCTSIILQIHEIQIQRSSSIGTRETVTVTSKVGVTTPLRSPPEEDNDSSYYSWIGEQWIPPNGRPVFSASDFLTYFQKRNVLFIGDSTARRAYTSIYAAMTAEDLTNVKTDEVDNPLVIDVGRVSITERCEFIERKFYNSSYAPKTVLDEAFMKKLAINFLCRNLPLPQGSGATTTMVQQNATEATEATERERDLASVDIANATTTIGQPAKFDYLRINCLGELFYLLTKDSDIDYKYKFESFKGDLEKLPTIMPYLEDYDLIVVAAGAWNVHFLNVCGNISVQGNDEGHGHDPVDHIKAALIALKDASSPNLQIAFRTPGFFADNAHTDVLWDMIDETKNFFKELEKEQLLSPSSSSPTTNMTLVDWGSNIFKKSFRTERIKGDISAHYGIGARMLFLQQLVHDLIVADGE